MLAKVFVVSITSVTAIPSETHVWLVSINLKRLHPLCCLWFASEFLDTGSLPVKDPQEHQDPTTFTAQALNCPK